MFKPFDVFCAKKRSKSGETGVKQGELRKEWLGLREKKLKKFVRKAETNFDNAGNENDNNDRLPFISYLSRKEATILFKKYYNMPTKNGLVNKRFFFHQKLEAEAQTEGQTNDSKKENRLKMDAKWNSLTETEREAVENEFDKANEEYDLNYFDFVRELPDVRVTDFKKYLQNSQESREEFARAIKKKKSEAENFHKAFVPFNLFLAKFKTENPQFDKSTVRNKASAKFKVLSSKKKTHLIKKAMKRYDQSDATNKLKAPFAKYLTRPELKLFLESYGMPNAVPNLTAYFFKANYAKYAKETNSMKLVAEKYKNLTEKERTELVDQHKKDLEAFAISQKKFLTSLPQERKVDFSYYKEHKKGVKANKLAAQKTAEKKETSTTPTKTSNKLQEALVSGIEEAIEAVALNANIKTENTKKPLPESTLHLSESDDEEVKAMSEDEDESVVDDDEQSFTSANDLDLRSKISKKFNNSNNKKSPGKNVIISDSEEDESETGDDENDGSKSSSNMSISINEKDKLQKFVNTHSKRPECPFSMFVHDELKWKVSGKMSEPESKRTLGKIGKQWLEMSESEKQTWTAKFISAKNDFKKAMKEFIMNELDNQGDLTKIELLNKINDAAYKKNRQIEFIKNDEGEIIKASFNDDLGLVHPNLQEINLSGRKTSITSAKRKSASSSHTTTPHKQNKTPVKTPKK